MLGYGSSKTALSLRLAPMLVLQVYRRLALCLWEASLPVIRSLILYYPFQYFHYLLDQTVHCHCVQTLQTAVQHGSIPPRVDFSCWNSFYYLALTPNVVIKSLMVRSAVAHNIWELLLLKACIILTSSRCTIQLINSIARARVALLLKVRTCF